MDAKQKKVLMLCYFYPPKNFAGTWRSAAFARILPEFSWMPTVLTGKAEPSLEKPIPGVRVKRTTEWDVLRIADFIQGAANRLCRIFGTELSKVYFKDLLGFPDPQIWWFSTIAGARLARNQDVLYVSCSPFSSAISGCWIKFLTGIPLVLDFRDPWVYDPDTLHCRPFLAGLKRLERWTVANCDALVVNSPGAKGLYEERFPAAKHKIRVIPNGYDELHPVAPTSKQDEKFRILHVGTLSGGRSPEPLMEALLQMNDSRIEFVQIGNDHPEFQRYRDRIKLTVVAQVERAAVGELMNHASLFYLRQSLSNSIAIASKTLEYLATGLPILAHCPLGDNSEMIQKYAKRSYLVHTDDPADLKQAIELAIADGGHHHPEVTPSFIRDLDRRVLTGELAQLFDSVARISA